MTEAQTTVRESMYRRFLSLSDDDASRVIAFIDALEGYEPNEETLAAFRESENLDNLPTYESIEEMFADFGINVDR